MKKVTISESQFNLMKEEVVADGSAEHNPYKKRWNSIFAIQKIITI